MPNRIWILLCALALALALAVPMWGQQNKPSELCQQINHNEVINDYACTETGWVKRQPLACDKYQTFVEAHPENCSTNLIGCYHYVPARCVENMHEVTEREWQELVDRIRVLEQSTAQGAKGKADWNQRAREKE